MKNENIREHTTEDIPNELFQVPKQYHSIVLDNLASENEINRYLASKIYYPSMEISSEIRSILLDLLVISVSEKNEQKNKDALSRLRNNYIFHRFNKKNNILKNIINKKISHEKIIDGIKSLCDIFKEYAQQKANAVQLIARKIDSLHKVKESSQAVILNEKSIINSVISENPELKSVIKMMKKNGELKEIMVGLSEPENIATVNNKSSSRNEHAERKDENREEMPENEEYSLEEEVALKFLGLSFFSQALSSQEGIDRAVQAAEMIRVSEMKEVKGVKGKTALYNKVKLSELKSKGAFRENGMPSFQTDQGEDGSIHWKLTESGEQKIDYQEGRANEQLKDYGIEKNDGSLVNRVVLQSAIADSENSMATKIGTKDKRYIKTTLADDPSYGRTILSKHKNIGSTLVRKVIKSLKGNVSEKMIEEGEIKREETLDSCFFKAPGSAEISDKLKEAIKLEMESMKPAIKGQLESLKKRLIPWQTKIPLLRQSLTLFLGEFQKLSESFSTLSQAHRDLLARQQVLEGKDKNFEEKRELIAIKGCLEKFETSVQGSLSPKQLLTSAKDNHDSIQRNIETARKNVDDTLKINLGLLKPQMEDKPKSKKSTKENIEILNNASKEMYDLVIPLQTLNQRNPFNEVYEVNSIIETKKNLQEAYDTNFPSKLTNEHALESAKPAKAFYSPGRRPTMFQDAPSQSSAVSVVDTNPQQASSLSENEVVENNGERVAFKFAGFSSDNWS